MASSEDNGTSAPLLASLPGLAFTLLDTVRTRVEILSTEIEEEREQLRRLFLYGFWSLFLTAIGLVLATVLIVFSLEEAYRVRALAAFAAVYLLLGGAIAARLHGHQRHRSRLFSTTLAELHKDCTAFGRTDEFQNR